MKMILRHWPLVALWVVTLVAPSLVRAGTFSSHQAPRVTPEKAASMEVRYFTELLTVHTAAGLERQFGPIADTQVTTVVCCPMGWRFYNFPSDVDRTWREPEKFPRDLKLFPTWQKLVDNLAAGGDPLRDALAATRRMGKRFVLSFRMNDSHYVYLERFPMHNNIWRANPDLRLGRDTESKAISETTAVFNYLRPEVRDFYFAVLEELCTKYDVDGVELDFQRAPRFFRDREIDSGRLVMTRHVERIRAMMDRVARQRGRALELSVRVLPTIKDNLDVGLDVLGWEASGWLDGIVVSSSYIHTADTGIEEFAAGASKARVYGELNYVHFQASGTGHNPNDRRYLTPETYRAATLSYLERGAAGVSFFNTYCVPADELKKLTSELLVRYRDLAVLKRSNKNYTTYANRATMFGRIFPAKDQAEFQVFIADDLPGDFERAAIRFESRQPNTGLHVEAWINGTKLEEFSPADTELFPPVAVNNASAKRQNLRFFKVPLSVLKFGVNQVQVRNLDRKEGSCEFVSSELALHLPE